MKTIQRNPFAVSCVQPGSSSYLFGVGDDGLDSLIQKFEKANWLGQIVGPHGSGKSTLVVDLVERIGDQFEFFRHVTIRQNKELHQRSQYPVGSLRKSTCVKPLDFAAKEGHGVKSPLRCLLVIDGIERLSRMQAWLTIQSCKRKCSGLLLTTHSRMRGVPELFSTKPTLRQFCELVEMLAPGLVDSKLKSELLQKIYTQHQPNIREALMKLYDWYEAHH
jgi:hypothetical protein